jgi:hypothetical protein
MDEEEEALGGGVEGSGDGGRVGRELIASVKRYATEHPRDRIAARLLNSLLRAEADYSA